MRYTDQSQEIVKKRGKIVALYTGAFRFPDKDAASQRVLGIAKVIREFGGEVMFCGWERKPRCEDKTDTGYIYQGFKYISHGELEKKSDNNFYRLVSYLLLGNKTIRWIKNHIKTNDVTHIICYHGTSLFMLKLYWICKLNNIKLIGDCTEISKYDQLPGGFFGLPNIDKNARIKIIYPLIKDVIVISSYLKRYLDNRGCRTIIIPPLVDLDETKWKIEINPINDKKSNFKRRLIYAGDPAKKDFIRPIILAISSMNKYSKLIEFILVGVSEDKFRKDFMNDDSNEYDFIRCLGRVDMQEIPRYYNEADFSILIRPDEEYANAGFPTKFVESFSSGVPVIANNTSDISRYLYSNQNGILLQNTNVEEIIKGIQKILNFSDDEILKLKQNAYLTAQNNFNYMNYKIKLSEFMNPL